MTEGHTLGHEEGGKELTPHCLVIACRNRNKQNPAFDRLIPPFTALSLPLWPLTACWASLRGCERGVRDIVSDSSHFLQISGGKSPVPCWRRSVLHFMVGESFQVHKPPFLPLFLCGQVLTLGTTEECDSISHARLGGWPGTKVTRLTNNIQEERKAYSKGSGAWGGYSHFTLLK